MPRSTSKFVPKSHPDMRRVERAVMAEVSSASERKDYSERIDDLDGYRVLKVRH